MIDSLLGQIKNLLKLFLVILYYLTKPHKQLNTQYTNISTTHSPITYMQEASTRNSSIQCNKNKWICQLTSSTPITQLHLYSIFILHKPYHTMKLLFLLYTNSWPTCHWNYSFVQTHQCLHKDTSSPCFQMPVTFEERVQQWTTLIHVENRPRQALGFKHNCDML